MSRIKKTQRSIAMITSALLLLASVSACSKVQTTQQLLQEAKEYQLKGDRKAAVIQLKNALQKDPENKDVRLLLGNIYNESGDPLSAEKELRKAVSLGVSGAEALPGIAKSLLMQGQLAKVLEETNADPRINTDAGFASMRGEAYLGLGKLAEAKEAFDLALKITPDFASAMVGLAKLSAVQQDMPAATKVAELAVSKNPKSAIAWMLQGDLLRAQNKVEAALENYTQAVKLEPENAGALLVKANIEISLKKFAEAKTDIDAAKKLMANPVILFYTQGLLDFSQNNNKAAWESLQQVHKLAPDYMPGVLLSGAVQFALGSHQQAEQFLTKFLQTNPYNAYANKLLAGVYLKSNKADKAVVLLEPLLKGNIDDSQLFGLAGEAYMQVKNFNKAIEFFGKATALAPKSAEYHTALGMSRLGIGDSENAIKELEKATSLDLKSSKAGVLLIMTHMRLKEFDKALSVANATEKEQPDNPVIQNLKGGIFLSKKDIPNARASFEKALTIQANFFPAISNLAQLDIQDKKPEDAKKRYLTLLEKDKKNIEAMIALANLAQTSGNKEEVKSWLERAYADSPESPAVAKLVVAYHVRSGDKAKAVAIAKKAQSSHSSSPEFMELLAQTQLAADDKNAALESYIKLAALLPQSAQALFKVAGVSMLMGNDSSAQEYLKKSLRLDEKFIDAQIGLIAIAVKNKKFDDAIQISRQIQLQNDKLALGFSQEGDILMAQKKAAAAIPMYEKALKLENTDQNFVKVYSALNLDGKSKDADARIVQWLKDHPQDQKMRMQYAMAHLASDKTKQIAIEQLQLILVSEPNNIMVLNNLAWALGEEKNPKALEVAEKANKLAPDNPSIMDTYGWILSQQGNFAKALPLIQKASSLQPDAMDIRFHLAQTLLKSGDKVKARKELEYIQSFGKDFAKMDEVKGLLKQL